MTTPTCPYCGRDAERVKGWAIYQNVGPAVGSKWFWRCPNRACDAYVGCHPPNGGIHILGDVPLGRLANHELREAKKQAHAWFDPLWKDGAMRRPAAYAWLAKKLDIPPDECHIGMMDVDRCRKVVEVCKARVS